MPNPRLAARYAKALLEISSEKGVLENTYADIQWLQKVFASNKDFVNVLKSPIIKADTKKKIVQAVTKGQIGEVTTAFNNLIITKGRESYLPEIVTEWIALYKRTKNIKIVHITTATALSPALKQQIISEIKKSAGYDKLEVVEKVDASLIGGYVLQVGDQLIDASVAYDLKAIARQFENNDFIFKIR